MFSFGGVFVGFFFLSCLIVEVLVVVFFISGRFWFFLLNWAFIVCLGFLSKRALLTCL